MGWSPNDDHSALDSKRVSTSSESDTGSPGKRKASYTNALAVEGVEPNRFKEPQQAKASVDSKRRKLGQHDGIDSISEVAAATAAPDDSDDDFLLCHLARIPTSRWYKKLEDGSMPFVHKSNVIASTDLRLGPNAFSDWAHGKHSSPPLSIPRPSRVKEINPPVMTSTTTAASTEALSQEQIQHNYREFEERQKRKAAEKAYYAATIPDFDGAVSPMDMNDQSMEHIFLSDGEIDETDDDADD
jgi:hypothetical protein